MRVLSVCSGIGAPELAWRGLGYTPVACSEIDDFPVAVMAHHWPDVPNWGDMTKYGEWPDAAIDVLVGGTPCQSFSVAGLRKGLDDPRGNLALTYLAIARRYEPRWIVWENVPGVLSSNGGRDFGAFLGGVAELGYGWAYRVLDAQFFGVPQRRRRVFVVGCLGDWRRAAAVLFERESLRRHPAEVEKKGAGAAGLFTARAGGGGPVGALTANGVGTCGVDDNQARAGHLIASHDPAPPVLRNGSKAEPESSKTTLVVSREIAPTLTADFGAKQGIDDQHISNGAGLYVIHGTQDPGVSDIAHPRARNNGQENVIAIQERAVSENPGAGPQGKGWQCDVAYTLEARHHVQAVAVHPCATNPSATSGPDGDGWQADLAYTLTSRTQAVGYGWQVRRLTPVECERLQGFPDGYTNISWRGKAHAPDTRRYKALGNSMAVPVMRWIGERIKAVDVIEVAA